VSVDLGALHLSAGEARKLRLDVRLGGVILGGEHYVPTEPRTAVTLDVSRLTGQGFALRLRLDAALEGPCVRCLEPAQVAVQVDAREVDQPGSGEELDSPYVERSILDLSGWAHDAVVLALPDQPHCREDCAGLCPVCAVNLNRAGPDHHHDRAPDPRWAPLRELG
jgi:uncharacterized protein